MNAVLPLNRAFGVQMSLTASGVVMSKDKKQRPNDPRKIVDLQKHPDPYVTTSDLAGYWRVSRKQIYKQIDAGTLEAIRLGPRLLRISTAEAIRFEDKAKISRMSEDQMKPHPE